jgi:FlaA1/EpsC-like NDP-sugar epimerase
VNSSGGQLDWREFLARPRLPAASPEILDDLARSPVLITGAGGSIGSALALRLAQVTHSGLVLLDSSENNLLWLERALDTQRDASPRAAEEPTLLLSDARDPDALENLFSKHRPQIVFHAAAYKHVPFLEKHPLAAIANNVFSTEVVTAAAAEHGAHIVLLSTDKAVEPVSVMGATKRVAEEIVLAHSGAVLRLGNVLGSTGSATEVFARQIAQGEPLTVTDPAARRYFLTLDEAVDLLLLAAVHRDRNAVLAPALETQHRIAELAAFMARALAPGREILIRFTGLRPGDKLEEQLCSGSEQAAPLVGGGLILVQSPRPDPARFAQGLAAMRAALRVSDLAAALADLCALVPGFRPSQTVLALAQSSRERACV